MIYCVKLGQYRRRLVARLGLFGLASRPGNAMGRTESARVSRSSHQSCFQTYKHVVRSSSSGIFSIAGKIKREIPIRTDEITHETIHLSVLQQLDQNPILVENVRRNPSIIASLLPLEEQVKAIWQPSETKSKHYQERKSTQGMDENHSITNVTKRAIHSGKHAGKNVLKHATNKKTMSTEWQPVYESNGFGKAIQDTSVGSLVKKITKPWPLNTDSRSLSIHCHL